MIGSSASPSMADRGPVLSSVPDSPSVGNPLPDAKVAPDKHGERQHGERQGRQRRLLALFVATFLGSRPCRNLSRLSQSVAPSSLSASGRPARTPCLDLSVPLSGCRVAWRTDVRRVASPRHNAASYQADDDVRRIHHLAQARRTAGRWRRFSTRTIYGRWSWPRPTMRCSCSRPLPAAAISRSYPDRSHAMP
jgi:hypothetical protein